MKRTKTTSYYCYNNRVYYPSDSLNSNIKNSLSSFDHRTSRIFYKNYSQFGIDYNSLLFPNVYRPNPIPPR